MATKSDSKWVPLEANPAVFNAWSKPLGLPSTLSFQDLYSLDPDFLQFTPQPVYAVLLLFPSRGKLGEEREKEEQTGEGVWKGKEGNGAVWWIKQTIGNACGSIGLLHSLLNLPSSGPHSLTESSPLTSFKSSTLPLTGLERAKRLDQADFFSKAHEAASKAGQSSVPETEEEKDVDLHFISFVKAEGSDGQSHIIELDGSRSGPFDRGTCTDFLPDTAKMIQEKYFDRSEGEVNFTLVVLAAKGEDDD